MKMLRDRKKFARCRVPGHGQGCSINDEIRPPMTRAAEKEEVEQEIREQLTDSL